MNRNNDDGQHGIKGPDGGRQKARSAFFRRDDDAREDNELTADAYLRSLDARVSAEMTMDSNGQQLDERSLPSVIKQPSAQAASSAQTRDAARLRSIMRGSEPTATSRTTPTQDMASSEAGRASVPTAMSSDVANDDVSAPSETAPTTAIPLPSEPVLQTARVQALSVTEPSLPPEIDITLPLVHDVPVIVVDHHEDVITLQSSSEGMVIEGAEEADDDRQQNITIMRYPVEECELIVPGVETEYGVSHTESPAVESTSLEAEENDVVIELEAMCEDDEVIAIDQENPAEDLAESEESESRSDDEQSDSPGLPASSVPPSLSLPLRAPVADEAPRKATRLRPPEPRATEVRLPRSVQIAPSNSATRTVPVTRERRGATVETRLRMADVEITAPRPIVKMAAQQTQMRSTARPSDSSSEPRPMHFEEQLPIVEQNRSQRFESISPMELSKREIDQQPQAEETMDPFAAEFQKKKKLVIAVSTVTVGVILGLGLYAGGADYVSGLFANKHEGIGQSRVAESSATSPTQSDRPSVTERAIDPGATTVTPTVRQRTPKPTSPDDAASAPASASPTSVNEPAVHSKTQGAAVEMSSSASKRIAQPSTKSTVRERSNTDKQTSSTRLAANVKGSAREKGTKNEKGAAQPTKNDQRLATHATVATKKTDAKSVAQKNGKDAFTVQVRATKDASEAKKIAAKLKSKGVRGVTIVASESGNSKLYRVRFGSYGSSADAKSAAGRAGVDGAWVVKQH